VHSRRDGEEEEGSQDHEMDSALQPVCSAARTADSVSGMGPPAQAAPLTS
jgi:hypothetical protein